MEIGTVGFVVRVKFAIKLKGNIPGHVVSLIRQYRQLITCFLLWESKHGQMA